MTTRAARITARNRRAPTPWAQRLAACCALLISAACSGAEGAGDGDPSESSTTGSGGEGMSETGGTSSGGTASGGGSGGDQVGSGGTDPSGGTGGGSGGSPPSGPCSAQPVDPAFTLRWEDNFDSLDLGRWELMSHTFAPNLAQFSPGNAQVEDGYLKLHFTKQQTGDREYRGAEVKSLEEFQYGRFDTCVRYGRGSGLVGSFFTYHYGPWNEIDIEYLGGNPVGIQYNIIFDPGPQYDPQFDPLGLDPADDFHHYSFEWVPGEVRFYVDGELRHTENSTSAQAIVEPSTLRMNIWAAWDGFAGNFDPNIAPTESWYDWVRVYDYND